MKCPVCDAELTMSERQGIEIDYCPKCRGVWLDRGELDKIIERSNSFASSVTPAPASSNAPNPGQQYSGQTYEQPYGQPQHNPNYSNQDYYYKKKRRKSFLEELFD